MKMRFSDKPIGSAIRRTILGGFLLAGSALVASAQPNRPAPRLEDPNLVSAEKSMQRPAKLEPVYDKAKDETTHFISSMMVIAEAPGREVQVPGESQKRMVSSGILKMVVYFKSPGKGKTKPSEVVIAFNSGNAFGFDFKDHRDLSIMLPDEQINLGRMNLVSQKDDGFRAYGFIRYWETLEIPVSLEVYKKTIAAKKVTLKIGSGSTALTGSQLKELRKYAKDLE